jgi:hypothetical protein
MAHADAAHSADHDAGRWVPLAPLSPKLAASTPDDIRGPDPFEFRKDDRIDPEITVAVSVDVLLPEFLPNQPRRPLLI